MPLNYEVRNILIAGCFLLMERASKICNLFLSCSWDDSLVNNTTAITKIRWGSMDLCYVFTCATLLRDAKTVLSWENMMWSIDTDAFMVMNWYLSKGMRNFKDQICSVIVMKPTW